MKPRSKKLISSVSQRENYSRKHLFFPLRHSHYEINVIEVDEALSVDLIGEFAENAVRTIRKVKGVDLRFLTAQKVKIATQEYINKTVQELEKKISKTT